jgi:hypothetical protein
MGEAAAQKPIASVFRSTWALPAVPPNKCTGHASRKAKVTRTPPVPQGPNLSAIELSTKPSMLQLYVHAPSCHLLPTILMSPDPVLCALPKWRSSDRVRLLSLVCMFQVHPKCPAFGRQPLFLSILPCIPFKRHVEEFRAIRCEFSFHHFVVLLISVW